MTDDRLPDFLVNDQGTVVLFHPLTVYAKATVRDILDNNRDVQAFGTGPALALDHHSAQSFVDWAEREGITFTTDERWRR